MPKSAQLTLHGRQLAEAVVKADYLIVLAKVPEDRKDEARVTYAELVQLWASLATAGEDLRRLRAWDWLATLMADVSDVVRQVGWHSNWLDLRPFLRTRGGEDLFFWDFYPEIKEACDLDAILTPLVHAPVVPRRRRCYERDHTWLRWAEKEKMTPAKIRDRWNREHPEANVGKGNAGCDVVKKGLAAARRDEK